MGCGTSQQPEFEHSEMVVARGGPGRRPPRDEGVTEKCVDELRSYADVVQAARLCACTARPARIVVAKLLCNTGRIILLLFVNVCHKKLEYVHIINVTIILSIRALTFHEAAQ